MLAGLFLDITIVGLLVIFIVLGIKQGYRGTVLHTIISIILTIAGAAGIGFVSAYFFRNSSGVSQGVNDAMMGWVEGSEFLLNTFGMTAEELAKLFGFILFFVIGFIVGLVIVGLLIWLINSGLNKLRNVTWFKIIDNTVAVIFNVVTYLVVVAVILAFINCLEGTTIMVELREFIKSTYVTRFLYQLIDKLLSMDMGGQTLRETLMIGHLLELMFG